MSKEDLQKELVQLNLSVTEAVKRRTEWMDAHMSDFATVQVGEELFDGDYQRLGVVTKLYRFWGDQRDWRYDTSMSVSYQYMGRGGGIDNTSRQSLYFVNSKADVERHERAQYEELRRKFAVTV